MWQRGEMLKGYRLEEKLGKGSFGEVWRAVKDGKVFAVKLLRCGTTDKANEGLAEAFLLIKVEHPHIVKAHEVFLAGDGATTVCIVMTLYEGTLEQLVKKGKVGEKVVLQMLREVCRGLSYLHERKQVIHRDVKPANVLVGDGGGSEKVFALGDLGLGRKVVTGEEKVTTLAGTPLFMAPEFFGEGHYSFKADMWALGVTACLCMFGQGIVEVTVRSLCNPHPEQREKAHREAVVLLEKHLSDKQLCTVVCALLLPDPVDRPSSTRVLEILDGTPPSSPSSSPSSPSPSPCPSNMSLQLMDLVAIAHLLGEERKRLLRVAVGSGVEDVRVAAEKAFAEDGLGRVRRVEVFRSDFDLFVDADSTTVFQDKGRVRVFPEHTHNDNDNSNKNKNSMHHHHDPNQHQQHPVAALKDANQLTSEEEVKRKGLVVEWEEGMEGFSGIMGKMQVVMVKHNELELLEKLKEHPPFLVIDFTGASVVDVEKRYVPIVLSFEHVVLKGVQGDIADRFLEKQDDITPRLRSLRVSLDPPVCAGSVTLSNISIGYGFLDECSSLVAIDLTPLSKITSIGHGFLCGCSSLVAIDLPPLSKITSIGHWFLSQCSSLETIDLTPLSQVTSIGDSFLSQCSSLVAIDLTPLSKITSIGDGFLYVCSSLEAIDFTPLSQVTSIGDSFLFGCSSLVAIDLSPLSKITSIGNGFLSGCKSLVAIDLTPLSKITSIGDKFLSWCSSLVAIDLTPLSKITNIGYRFLSGCTSLKAVKANNSLCLPEELEKLRQ